MLAPQLERFLWPVTEVSSCLPHDMRGPMPSVVPAMKRWRRIAVLLPFAAGCSSGGTAAKYSPNVDTARQAIEASLAAWKRGEPPGEIVAPGTTIHLVDSTRQVGQTLASYEILGEVPGEGGRHFSVHREPRQGFRN